MSKAWRETKWLELLDRLAGQISPPVQRRTHVLLARSRSLAHRVAAAAGQMVGNTIGLRVGRPLVEHDVDDLRDDVAGALDGHRVADADVLPSRIGRRRPMPLISPRCAAWRWHDDAADGDRLQPGDRRQRAGAADLDVDAAQDGRAPARPGTCARSPSAALRETKPSRSCKSSRSTL